MTAAGADALALVTVSRVAKTYGRTQALADVSLVLRRGRIHGIVGPNGSGKSTFIRLLLGLEPPDTGAIVVHEPAGQVRMAYQPQVPALYDYLKVAEFLELSARLAEAFTPERCARISEWFELVDSRGALIKTLSVGTQMKVAIAAAFVQNAPCSYSTNRPIPWTRSESRVSRTPSATRAVMAAPSSSPRTCSTSRRACVTT
jgi:ABC-2 type transport system ATP-binding protein